MEQKLCLSCRAENPSDADFCWKCYATFAGMNAPLRPPGPGETGDGARSARSQPSPRRQAPGSSPLSSLWANKTVRYAAIGASALVVLLAGRSMLVSPAFPDSIGAYERNSDADPDGKQGALDWGTDNRIEVRVETYESKLQQGSTFAVVKISGWSDRMTYEEVLLSFAGIGSPTIIVPGAIQTFDIDGVEITCVATKVPSLSSCQWVGGEDQIILISSSAGVQETLALTGSARTAL